MRRSFAITFKPYVLQALFSWIKICASVRSKYVKAHSAMIARYDFLRCDDIYVFVLIN